MNARDEIDRQAKVTEAARSTNTMQIRLTIPGKIKIDDHIHGLNINATSKQVTANEVAASTWQRQDQ